MSTYGWLLDPKRCIECRACETACKQWNGVPVGVGVRYRTVRVIETGAAPNVRVSWLSGACNHCENAICIKVCPVKAIARRADGIVLIDQSKCLGCRQCEKFCPYGAPQFNVAEKKMQKCTMCTDRVEKNLAPACATLCPTGALQWGDWEQLQKQGADRVDGFANPALTKPRIRFVTTGWGK